MSKTHKNHARRWKHIAKIIRRPVVVLSVVAIAFAVVSAPAQNAPAPARYAPYKQVDGANTDTFQYGIVTPPPATVKPSTVFKITTSLAHSTAYKFGASNQEFGGTSFFLEDADGNPSTQFQIERVDSVGSEGTKTIEDIVYLAGDATYTVTVTVAKNITNGMHTFRLVPNIMACEKKPNGTCSFFTTAKHAPFSGIPIIPPVYEFTVTVTGGKPAPAPSALIPTRVSPNESPAITQRAHVTRAPGKSATKKTPANKTATGEENSAGTHSMAGWIITLFLLGLLATLMPCTYPMIPLVVSQLTPKTPSGSGEDTPNAAKRGFSVLPVWLAYVAGMLMVTIPLGLLAGAGAKYLSAVTVSVWFNALMVALFVIFAFNLFGAFEIRLPSSLLSRMQVKQGNSRIVKGFLLGVVGIFVSFSCTAAIIAAAIAGMTAHSDNWLTPTLSMSAFGIGFAIPYGFLMLTAGSLPKPGQWMNTVKKSAGILLILVSFWFLQIVVPGAYYALVVALTLIVLAVFTGAFTHLEKSAGKLDYLKKAAGIILFLFGLLFFVKYTDEAGWLDAFKPVPTQIVSGSSGGAVDNWRAIKWEHNVDDALKTAAKENKPVLVDFRSDTCSTCRKMERSLFSDPDVINAVMRHFIPVKLDLSGNSPTATHAREVQDKYKKYGVPLFLYLKPDGALIDAHPGGYTKAEFLDALQRVREPFDTP